MLPSLLKVENAAMNYKPKKWEKIFFWIVLGFLSVFFAEAVSGSQIFAFFTAWGYIAIFPLYTLHTLVLGYIAFRFGRGSFYPLYFAGTLFGMYEAYITKVLWLPPWSEKPFTIGGVGVIETLMLVFFWHAFMSFIVPLFVAENVLTSSRFIGKGLPERLKNFIQKKESKILIIAAVLCGLSQSVNSPTAMQSLLSGSSTTACVIALMYLWRRNAGRTRWTITELLPNKKEFIVLFVLLGIFYALTTFGLTPEKLPKMGPQITIWILYAILITLLILSFKKSRNLTGEPLQTTITFSWKLVFLLAGTFTATSTLSVLLFGNGKKLAGGIVWIAGILAGVITFILAVRFLCRKQSLV
jgi:hypothetical protein